MEYRPLNYENINLVAGTYTPSQVRPCDNESYVYWQRSLLQRAMSVIRIDDLPKEWHGNVKDFLWYCMFKLGYVVCFNNTKFGRTFQPCTLRGFDWYYQPTDAKVVNPKLELDLKIHKDCEILKLCPDYTGIWDVICRYARRLSTFDPSIDMAIINSKYSLIMGASTKGGTTFLKKVNDKINEGDPAVIFDAKALALNDPQTKESAIVDLSRKDIKNTYLGAELLQDFETVLHEFDTEIGIPTLPYQKKERMITDEAESKQVDAVSRSLVWVDTMNECFELINPMLGTNMKAVHNYAEQIEQSANTDNESEVVDDE